MELIQLRDRINEIDEEIVQLFAERMRVSERIALYKKQHGLPVLDEKREQEKINEVAAMLPNEFRTYGSRLYERIMELSRDYQETCIGKR